MTSVHLFRIFSHLQESWYITVLPLNEQVAQGSSKRIDGLLARMKPYKGSSSERNFRSTSSEARLSELEHALQPCRHAKVRLVHQESGAQHR